MKKNLFLLILTYSFLIFNSGCAPTLPVVVDEDINYSQEIQITGDAYAKLSYLWSEWLISKMMKQILGIGH